MSSGDPPAPEAPADEPLAEPQIEADPGEPEVDEVPAQPKAVGSVKWFSVTKGFGFIQPDEGEGELFVHQTSILADGFRSLREGERVEFDLEVAEDGRAKAINVTGPEGAPPQGAPRRVFSAQQYNMPQYVVMAPPAGHFMPGPMPGRGPRPGRVYPARGAYGGRGQLVQYERPPPPGTPGFSSGFQVVVHNIPWSMTWQELKDIFSSTPGVVRADVIVDASGRSRGFGTVRYSTREEANAAAETMNNIDIGGRIVSVRIDRFA